MTGIAQNDLIAKLDSFFETGKFDESTLAERLPREYGPILARYAVSSFNARWNGLLLSNAESIDRMYLLVVPTQAALDTIIAREVKRGAPGALIFSHHFAEAGEESALFQPIPEAQLAELHEHRISVYICHEPLDRHPRINTSLALAEALKLRESSVFAAPNGGTTGAHGTIGPIGFHELAKRAAESTGLPVLRYSSIRHNGRPVERVAAIAGIGGTDDLRAAAAIGVDTVVTGEWWPGGPNGTQSARRTAVHDFLQTTDLNLIGTSRYASESPVLRDGLLLWIRENAPGVESQFVAS